MKIEVTQCSMCTHYNTEQFCEVWKQYISNDAFYCACGVKADRKTKQMANDLIRKSDVLETYADLYDIFDDNKTIQEELHKVFDKINNIPVVESSNSEKPNNSTISKMEQVETMSCQECKHWKYVSNYGWDCEFKSVEDCKYEPKDEPQTDCPWR